MQYFTNRLSLLIWLQMHFMEVQVILADNWVTFTYSSVKITVMCDIQLASIVPN